MTSEQEPDTPRLPAWAEWAIDRLETSEIDALLSSTDDELKASPDFGRVDLHALRRGLLDAYQLKLEADWLDSFPISHLGLSKWPKNALLRAGYTTIGDIKSLSDRELLIIRNLGAKGLAEIRELLANPPQRVALPDSEAFSAARARLHELPSPDPAAGADPTLLLLLDDALEAAFGHRHARNREIVRARMSLPEGGPWKALRPIGEKFGISGERVRQITAKLHPRLGAIKDPRIDLLGQYVRRTSAELGDGDLPDGIAQLAQLAFPEGPIAQVIDILVAVGVEAPSAERKKTGLAAMSAYKRRKAEAKSQAQAEIRRSKALPLVEDWISGATWPQNPALDAGLWVPTKPGRETDQTETACKFDSSLLGRPVGCDSQLELRFYERLEASQLAQWYVEQPFSIPYADAFGHQRHYWPDALVHLTDGRWLLVEVKPTISLVTEPDQRKWAAAAERCAIRGVGFLVINPATSTSLGHLLGRKVPTPLADHLNSLAKGKETIGWHQGRQTKEGSPSNIKDFAAWVLQQGKASIPHRGWCIAPLEHDYQARNWASAIDITPERSLHPADARSPDSHTTSRSAPTETTWPPPASGDPATKQPDAPARASHDWSDTERADLLKSAAAGLSVEELAARHQRSVSAMKLQLKKLDLVTRDSPLVRMLEDGWSIDDLADHFAESPWVLINRLHRSGYQNWDGVLHRSLTDEAGIPHSDSPPKPHPPSPDADSPRTETTSTTSTPPTRAGTSWTEDEDDLLFKQVRAGANLNDIARRHERSEGAIHSRLKKLNLVTHDSEIVHLLHEGWTIDELAGTFGEDSAALYERFIRSGITPTKTTEDAAPPNDAIDRKQSEPPKPEPARPEATSESIPSNELCRHDLVAAQCSTCKYDGEPPVYIVDGGAAFHSRPDCPALESGQRAVELRGGIPSEVRQVSRGSNELADRQPCIVCFPNGDKT